MTAIAFQSGKISLALSGRQFAETYFLCLQGPHDNGTLFRLRTTLKCGSGGDCPALDDVVEGGVGGMMMLFLVNGSIGL